MPGEADIAERRAERAGCRPGGGAFAVLEPVEAPGPLLVAQVRDTEPDRGQPQVADREAVDADQPAHQAID